MDNYWTEDEGTIFFYQGRRFVELLGGEQLPLLEGPDLSLYKQVPPDRQNGLRIEVAIKGKYARFIKLIQPNCDLVKRKEEVTMGKLSVREAQEIAEKARQQQSKDIINDCFEKIRRRAEKGYNFLQLDVEKPSIRKILMQELRATGYSVEIGEVFTLTIVWEEARD